MDQFTYQFNTLNNNFQISNNFNQPTNSIYPNFHPIYNYNNTPFLFENPNTPALSNNGSSQNLIYDYMTSMPMMNNYDIIASLSKNISNNSSFNENLFPKNNEENLKKINDRFQLNKQHNVKQSKFKTRKKSQNDVYFNSGQIEDLNNLSSKKYKIENVNKESINTESHCVIPTPKEKEEKADKAKYFKCIFSDCEKVFLKETCLIEHYRVHTKEKPYICSYNNCGRKFSQLGNLKKHEKVHSGYKKFFCDFPACGKKFSASYNLKVNTYN